jgi:hypothetical protein
MFSVIPKLAPPMYVYSQFNLKHGASVQIKPDQIKSKRRSLGLKHNRTEARTGHLQNIDSDKSPNLYEVIRGYPGSNQTRPDQIKASLPRFETQPTRSTHRSSPQYFDSDKSPNLYEVIRGCPGSNQARPDQIKASLPWFKTQSTRSTHRSYPQY